MCIFTRKYNVYIGSKIYEETRPLPHTTYQPNLSHMKFVRYKPSAYDEEKFMPFYIVFGGLISLFIKKE